MNSASKLGFYLNSIGWMSSPKKGLLAPLDISTEPALDISTEPAKIIGTDKGEQVSRPQVIKKFDIFKEKLIFVSF